MNPKFLYNLDLMKKAVAFEEVDRVPYIPCGPAFFPIDGGITLKEATTDYALATKVNLAQHLKYKATGTQADTMCPYALSGYWLSKVAVPGVELGDNELWQMQEQADFVTQDDYQEIIETGFGPWYTKFKKEKLNDVDAKMLPYFMNAMSSGMAFAEAGIPVTVGALMITPFEYMCGGRGLEAFLCDDIFDEPELTRQVFDKVMEFTIPFYTGLFKQTHPLGAWIGGWRAAPALASPSICKEWAMDDIRKYVDLCIEHNVIPILHLDSDWEKGLEFFKDFPEKKCIMALDGKTDIYKAKEVLGDRMCIMGDVPPEMLSFGTYDEVYAYCEKLIHEIGPTGFILSSGCDIPLNAKPECVMAMGDAAEQVSTK